MNKLLKPDCPINDYVLLLAIIRVYQEVMRERGNLDLVAKAEDLKKRLG